ncbi:MAG: PRD domain-containing protein [Halanaerobiales bacterium]
MDKDIKNRLKILYEGDQIDKEIKEVVNKSLKMLETEYDLQLTEDNAAKFVTHLAMALMRIKNGEEVEGLNEVALQEVKQEEGYDFSLEFSKFIEDEVGLDIPGSEKGYIALHICNLINQS